MGWDLRVHPSSRPGHESSDEDSQLWAASGFDVCHQIWRHWRDEDDPDYPWRLNDLPEETRARVVEAQDEQVFKSLSDFWWWVRDARSANDCARTMRNYYAHDIDITSMAEWLEYWANRNAGFRLSF